MTALKVIGAMFATAIVVILIAVFGFGMQILGIKASGITEPMKEQVRMDVYDNSQARIVGTRKELARLQMAYVNAKSDAQRSSVCSLAKLEATGIDPEQIPNEQRSWLEYTC